MNNLLKTTGNLLFSGLVKHILLVVLIAVVPNSSSLFGQQLPSAISVNEASFREVIDTIEAKTPYSFVLDYSAIEEYAGLRFTFTSNSLEEILTLLTRDTKLQFRIVNKHVVLSKTEAERTQALSEVRGRVVDETDLPVPGVSIYVLGTSNGTVSDVNGYYTIQVDRSGNPVLVFSYVGYVKEELSLNGREELNVKLKPDIEELEEVIVVGYGTANKEELTSAIVQIEASNLKPGASNNPIELIKGKVPGLSIVNQAGNDPNSHPQVLLRGIGTISADNEPLVIIDGVYSSIADLYLLNANDIESFNVLKDGASTAIYGTRGSNGVIIVKTKTGKGEKSNLEYTAYAYLETPSAKPDVLNNEEYVDILRSMGFPSSETDKGYNTYWFDELIQHRLSQYHNLSYSKSHDHSAIRVSIGRKDHHGVALNTYNKTTNFRINYNQKLLNRITISSIIGGSRSEQRFTDYGAFDESLKYDPTAPVYNEDGSYYELPGVGVSNPKALLEQRENLGTSDRFSGSLEGTIDLLKDLSLSVKGSTFLRGYEHRYFESIDSRNSQLSGIAGTAMLGTEKSVENVFESILNYKLGFGDHFLKAMAGYSFIQNERATSSMTNRNFLTNAFGTNNIGAGSFLEEGRASMNSYREKSRLLAYFGRLNYSFRSRYLLNASIRREGASVFGENNKWGWFPSLSGAWRISEEDFFADVSMVDELKLRVGYGVTGRSQGIPMYQSLSRIGYSGNAFFNGQWIGSYGSIDNANPDLRWERTRELNIGADFSFWNQRVGGAIDIYDRLTTDLLGNFITQTPPSLESTIFANVGTIRNMGTELNANVSVINATKFKFDVAATYAWNRNEVVSLSNDQFQADSILYADYGNVAASLYLLAEDQPIGTFYGFKFMGFSPSGKWVFEDQNNDDLIQEVLDFTVLGNGLPKHLYSFSTNFSYGGFFLHVYFVGAAGFQIFNAKRLWYENTTNSPSNYFSSILESPNDHLDDRLRFSDYYLENGDYLRIDNLSFGYRFSKLQKVKALEVYFSASNLYTITAYSGLDPEVGSGTGDGLTPGWDRRSFYPRTRTFQIGLKMML